MKRKLIISIVILVILAVSGLYVFKKYQTASQASNGNNFEQGQTIHKIGDDVQFKNEEGKKFTIRLKQIIYSSREYYDSEALEFDAVFEAKGKKLDDLIPDPGGSFGAFDDDLEICETVNMIMFPLQSNVNEYRVTYHFKNPARNPVLFFNPTKDTDKTVIWKVEVEE